MSALAHEMWTCGLRRRCIDDWRRSSLGQTLQHLNDGIGHAGEGSDDLDHHHLICLIAADRSLLGDAIEPDQIANSFDGADTGNKNLRRWRGLYDRRARRDNPRAHDAAPLECTAKAYRDSYALDTFDKGLMWNAGILIARKNSPLCGSGHRAFAHSSVAHQKFEPVAGTHLLQERRAA